MEDLITYFQKQFQERISIKAGAKNETQVIINSFKYFDLNRNGTLQFPEFCQALEKLGAKLIPEKDLLTVFQYFDLDGNGTLNYREFARIIQNPLKTQDIRPEGFKTSKNLSNPLNPAQIPQNTQISSKRSLADTLDLVKAKVKSRGAEGIVGLGRLFRIMDDNQNYKLEFPEFFKAMQEYRIGLEDWEIRDIFDFFDLDQTGTLNYNEFLIGMRGPLSTPRLELIDLLFDCLDLNKNGVIQIDDIRDLYDTTQNKKVISGEKTAEEILQNFLNCFEGNFSIKGVNDGIITREEFLDYYGFVSASIDHDEDFKDMIYKSWLRAFERARQNAEEEQKNEKKINNYNKNYNNFENEQNDAYAQYQADRKASKSAKLEQLMLEMRQKLRKRGIRGFTGIQRQFRVMDEDKDGFLAYPEFLKAMRDFRLGFSDNTILAIFTELDHDKNGKLDIDEFNKLFIGEMNPWRRQLVDQVFDKLDINKNGKISEQELTRNFYARGHPEFKNGTAAVDSILSDFVDTFKEHHNLRIGQAKGKEVSREEFREYYNNVSCQLDDDTYFEQLVVNCWKLLEPAKPAPKPVQNFGRGRRNQNSAGNYQYNPPWGVTKSEPVWETSNGQVGKKNLNEGMSRNRYY